MKTFAVIFLMDVHEGSIKFINSNPFEWIITIHKYIDNRRNNRDLKSSKSKFKLIGENKEGFYWVLYLSGEFDLILY
jgi:hypothetical protein